MRKKLFITGGERGIGLGISKCLAKVGYDIAFSYYPKEHFADEYVNKAKDELKKLGADVHAFPADYSKKEEAKRVFEEVVAKLGGLDLLVNIAGINKPKAIQDLDEENMDYVLTLDFRTYIMMMHYAARYMIDHNIKGNIINITSSRGERVYPNCGLYCGIKAGINKATEAFALDVAKYGIRINNVAPGAVRIRSKEDLLKIKDGFDTDYFWSEEYINAKDIKEDFWDQLGEKIPLKRVGLPEDVANTVEFLISDKASYITGVTLRVDGGLILPGMPEGSSMSKDGWS